LYKKIVVSIEPMYMSTRINVRMLWFQFHGVVMISVYIYWMVCLQFVYILCYAFCFNAMCVYVHDSMMNPWSMWKQEYKFQLFLFLIILVKSVVKGLHRVSWRSLSFTSENPGGKHCSYTSRTTSITQIRERCVQASGSLRILPDED
jgi:hypothetical protein